MTTPRDPAEVAANQIANLAMNMYVRNTDQLLGDVVLKIIRRLLAEQTAELESCRKFRELWLGIMKAIEAANDEKMPEKDISQADAYISAWRKQKEEIERLKAELAEQTERAETAEGEATTQAGELERLRTEVEHWKQKHFDDVMAAKKSGYEEGQIKVERLRAFAEKFCPKCDGCGQLLLGGGVTEADGITAKPCRAVCIECHEAAKKGKGMMMFGENCPEMDAIDAMERERNHLEYARRCATGLMDEGDHVGGQSVDAVCDEVERLRLVVEENDRLIEALTAIVDKLPKTADGVAVTGGETLHVAYGSGLIHPFVATGPYITSTYGIEGAYSTRAAAETAGGE